MKKLLAIVISMAMIVAMMPMGVFADGTTESTEPTVEGDVIKVNPQNVQDTLDGKYGSIDNKTILLSTGTYDQLELGRATKYAGSNTEYRIDSFNADLMDFQSFYARKNDGTYSGVPHYIRNMSNVTFKEAQGAEVNINGVLAASGHHYQNDYDYVLDRNVNGNSYFLAFKFENITFEGINFINKSDINTSLEETIIDGFTFKDCTFNINNTDKENQAIRYYNENNNGKVKNLTVDNCEFKNCYQGVYTSHINGIKVINSAFVNTAHNAIAIQDFKENANHGVVVITNNTFNNIKDRIIRFNRVGADTQITIKNNKAVDSGNSAREVIKAESLAEGITYDICGNAWGENKSIANDNLKDKEAVAKIDEVQYTDLQAAIDAASDGDTIKLLNDITVTSIGKETKATDSKGNEITYYAIDKSITLDLNEKVLTTNQRYTTSIKGDEKKVNIINGSIEAQNLADITSALFNIKTGCELSLDNVKLSTNACALFPQGDAAKLVCKNSEISAVTYAVGTNAGTTDNYNVQIILDHSGFSTTGADSCAVMINVKGSLKADYCTIVGGRQGLIVRAGDATVNNSKIISRTKCTEVANKYYINEDGTVVNETKWKSGNEVPQAGVVVGNYYNSSVSESSYAYLAEAKLDITNTDISVEDATLATIYLADNKVYKAIMNINGNSNITGALIDKTRLTESGIVIKGGTFTVDPDDYVYPGYTATKKNGKFVVSAPYTPVAPSTTTDKVTNNSTEKKTTADLAPAVKDNKAETTVDAKTADKIVDKAVANKSTEVIVDAAGNNTVASSEVAIPEKTVKELAEKTDANLVIKTDNGKVDLDKTALAAVAEQAGTTGTVRLVVETVKTDENICHVNLKLITSNGAVKDFRGGNVKVTINLDKELAAKELVCVYIDDNGIYTLVEGVLNADGTYTFTTGHFSEYAVMAKAEADKKIAEQLNTLIKEVNLKVRTSKTSKKNIKAVVSGDVTALTDAGYTVKYKFYKSTKKASKYTAAKTKDTNTYINTAGKKGTKYYYKAKAMVYSGDTLVGQTVLKQCKYGVRTWSK